MKKLSYTLIVVALLSITIFSSCKKEDPIIPNEEELITTITYTLTPVGGGDVVELKFQDLDGEGGNAPVIITEPLAANTTYTGVITMLNELETPPHDIAGEVQGEAAMHQFFFIVEGGANAEISYSDEDINGNPLGLATSLETTGASTGTLTIVLRHEPKKPNDGTLTDAGGGSDIEVEFDISIQ